MGVEAKTEVDNSLVEANVNEDVELLTEEEEVLEKKPGKLDFLFEERKGKKIGIWVSMAMSLISLILLLPFVNWISVVNKDQLLTSLSVKGDNLDLIKNAYTTFNFLSFVQYSGAGILGLFAMIVLIIGVASAYFQIMFLIKTFRRKKSLKGNLGLFGAAEAAMFFAIFHSLISLIYIIFANSKVGMTGFVPTAAPILTLIVGIVGYVAVKAIQKKERDIYHEHGLLVEIKKNWVLFLMLVPTFIYFLINNYAPMAGVYYAFTQFNFRDGLWASPFIGFKNFEYLVSADLYRLTRNTVLYNIVFIILGNILQIIFAILVSQVTVKWFKKVSQTLMFMPYFVSFVILKVIIYNIFEYQYGVINGILVAIGGESARIDFYNTPSYWPFLITFFFIWKNIGYGMVVYLATIMGIDAEMYEAAKVDGANIFHQIRYITIPQLKPTFIILLLYALGGIMKGQFELFYQMVGTNGVLYNITDILDTYVYRIAMTQPLSIGLGTAAGLYQSVFGFILIVVTNWVVKRKNAEYALF